MIEFEPAVIHVQPVPFTESFERPKAAMRKKARSNQKAPIILIAASSSFVDE